MPKPTGTNPRTRARRVSLGQRLALPPLLALVAALLPTPPVRAGEFEDASGKLSDLEERVRSIATDFKDAAPADPAIAMRRVVDADMLFKLKNYSEAATILLDVVEKYPNSPGYDDALVLLGESLFQEKDYNSARHYFLIAAKRGGGSRQEQQALQRLIEIGLHTEDFENVDDYLKRLENIPIDRLEPSVPYVRGKYAYFRDRLDEALLTFANIPPTSPYYLQSRYFAATVQVKKGDLAAALGGFDAVTRVQPRNDGEKEIQEMARLAIGRLYYERDQFDKAREAYGSVARQSLHFEDAMNELAWTSIKAKDFKAAYRALDLMLLQNPDSPQAPELRLLMGNLHVRLANFALANDAFLQAREQFDAGSQPASGNPRQVPSRPQVLRVLDWQWNGEVRRLGDRSQSRDEMGEGRSRGRARGRLDRGCWRVAARNQGLEQTLSRLEMAVAGQIKVGIFPDLAAVRTRSSEVLNQIVEMRRRFGAKMRMLTAQHLSVDDKARLEQIGVERMVAEKELEGLPLTAAALQEREKRAIRLSTSSMPKHPS